MLKIFTLEGETLELSENRLKAKSAADYYKRLTYLVIYAGNRAWQNLGSESGSD